jgi:hypothetical protein
VTLRGPDGPAKIILTILVVCAFALVVGAAVAAITTR